MKKVISLCLVAVMMAGVLTSCTSEVYRKSTKHVSAEAVREMLQRTEDNFAIHEQLQKSSTMRADGAINILE